MALLEKVTAFLNPETWKRKAVSMVVKPVVALAIIFWWWGVPVLVFPASWFWPFGWVLSKPSLPAGALGALGWYVVCNRAVSRVLSAVQ